MPVYSFEDVAMGIYWMSWMTSWNVVWGGSLNSFRERALWNERQPAVR